MHPCLQLIVQPKELIHSIYKKYEEADALVLQSLSGSINRLQKAFPKRGHFLMEFIQNADDCASESLKIVIDRDCVNIYNNGRPFSERDVRSICQVGRSSKTPESYIGYLGVGFKSAFLVSEEPHVFSGGFSFRFSRKAHEEPGNVPWQIMPIWVEAAPQKTEVHWWRITFHLPFSYTDPANIQRIKSEIESESISSRLLLFLRFLRQIAIHNNENNSRRVLKKSSIIEAGSDYEIYELSEEKDGVEELSRWLLFRSQCSVPDDVRKDSMTIEWERQDVQAREVIVAFRLDGSNRLIEEKGAAHIGVFSFLPLKEEIEGMKFLIQGDFLTAPGRETLSRKALWNEWLCSEITSLITQKCIPIFLRRREWRLDFIRLLHSKSVQDHFFDQHLKKKINAYIESNDVLVAEDGSLVPAGNAVRIGHMVRELIDEDISRTFLKGKKILHPHCDTGSLRVSEGPTTITHIIEQAQSIGILTEKARLHDVNWFRSFYRKLSMQCREFPELCSDIRNDAFILTGDFRLLEAERVYLPTKEVPQECRHAFTIANSGFAHEPGILDFFRALGMQEIQEQHIKEVMDERQVPLIAEGWKRYGDDEKTRKLHFLFEMWNRRKVESRSLSFLTLRTRSGEWKSPESIKLGNEWSPSFAMERILSFIREKINGLPDELRESIEDKLEHDLTCDFLDAAIIPEPENPLWLKFLEELGVNRRTKAESISLVNRLSVIYVFIYEWQHRRCPRELAETEKRGYDLESHDGDAILKIEVKGSENPEPNLWLPANEFASLVRSIENNEQYYVYIVGNVLDVPRIYRLKGSDVKEAHTGVNLDAYKWKKLAVAETV